MNVIAETPAEVAGLEAAQRAARLQPLTEAYERADEDMRRLRREAEWHRTRAVLDDHLANMAERDAAEYKRQLDEYQEAGR